jgi:uncharacterized lipoprotein YddW (UPF0748 family)
MRFPYSYTFSFVVLLSAAAFQVQGQVSREFRAVWVATVNNIDWPSSGNYDPRKQRQEFIELLELHKKNGINAVIVQIRPCADAFYPSPFEPWSEWLTGKQGKPPHPYYDPLQFMIEETHKRGMEFHAWCNPYRAVFDVKKSSIAPTHITRRHPEWFFTYGDKKYFDPGHPKVQEFVVNVIRDVVSRYAVDAIHFDDYFYPYRIEGKELPDEKTYTLYGAGQERDAWRRSNVDSIIAKLSRVVKSTNSTCRFGISPFGVWRNLSQDSSGSATQAGQTNYDDLYADILLWLKQGWIDYVIPQLYWEFGHPRAAYEILLDWWNQHTYGKHCYIGLGMYRAGSNPAWKDKSQLPRQIAALRTMPNIQGMAFFSSASFQANPNNWNDSLQQVIFAQPAVVPSMNWIEASPPAPPGVQTLISTSTLGQTEIQLTSSDAIRLFVIYEWPQKETNTTPKIRLLPAENGKALLSIEQLGLTEKTFAVSALDINNLESSWVWLGAPRASTNSEQK